MSDGPFRLVATDLDGTLLRSTTDASEYTIDVLRRVQESGALVVPVTARAPRSTQPIAEALGIRGHAVCGTGSLLYDLERGELILDRPFDAEVPRRIVEALRELIPGVVFAAERRLAFTREPGFRTAAPILEVTEADALEFADGSVTKLIARHTAMELELLLETVERAVGTAAVVGVTGGDWVEIRAHASTKMEMLAELCARLGVAPAEVVAFGDLPVDIPMLGWAGHGVAPDNAHDAVKATADEIAPSNDEDGVAVVLDRLLADGRMGPG